MKSSARRVLSQNRAATALLNLSRRAKQVVMVGFDVVGLPLALLAAFAIKSDAPFAGLERNPLLYAGVVLASVPVFIRLGLYRSVVRYIGPRAARAILRWLGQTP